MPEPAPVGRRAADRTLAVAAVAVAVTAVLPVFLVGALGVQLRASVGLSPSLLGAGVAIFFGVAALTSRGMGLLAERTGPVRGVVLSGFGGSVSLLALTFVTSWIEIFLFLGIAGLCNAMAQPSTNAMLSATASRTRRALALGIKQSAMPAAALLGGIAVPTIALTVGWRWAFAGAGIGGLIATVSCFLFGRPQKPVGIQASGARIAEPGILWLFGLAAGLGTAASTELGTFIVSSGKAINLSAGSAGFVEAAGSALGLLVRIAAGWLGGKSQRDPLKAVAVMLLLGALGYEFLSLNDTQFFLVGVALGFGAGWAWTGLFNFAVVERYPHAVASATGLTQTGVFGGAAVGPALFGVISQHYSLAAAWTLTAVTALVAAGVIIWAAWVERSKHPAAVHENYQIRRGL